MSDDNKDDLGMIEDIKLREQLFKKRWENRRKMAWVSLVSMVLMTIAMLFFVPEVRLDKLQDVISWAFMTFASVIGGYMAVTTWAAKK